ncbi:hypothetical protein [Corynebacterium rouxii]|uniref:hypothetical protein n=1 Tax=Corynebacterium rouxii TaxID=2719119 RepID=UPI00313BE044
MPRKFDQDAKDLVVRLVEDRTLAENILGTTLQAHRHARLTHTSLPADENRPVRVSIMRVLGDFRF